MQQKKWKLQLVVENKVLEWRNPPTLESLNARIPRILMKISEPMILGLIQEKEAVSKS